MCWLSICYLSRDAYFIQGPFLCWSHCPSCRGLHSSLSPLSAFPSLCTYLICSHPSIFKSFFLLLRHVFTQHLLDHHHSHHPPHHHHPHHRPLSLLHVMWGHDWPTFLPSSGCWLKMCESRHTHKLMQLLLSSLCSDFYLFFTTLSQTYTVPNYNHRPLMHGRHF